MLTPRMHTEDSLLRPLVVSFVLFGVSLLGSPAAHCSGLSAMKMEEEQSQPGQPCPSALLFSPAREASCPGEGHGSQGRTRVLRSTLLVFLSFLILESI